MASVVISGDSSGSVTLSAPAVAGSSTQTLVAATGTLAPLVSGTAVASTSGTSINFTGIPSWAKRITVMFNGVSTAGSNEVYIRLGTSVGIESSGYTNSVSKLSSVVSTIASTSGIQTDISPVAGSSRFGQVIISNLTGNTWTNSGAIYDLAGPYTYIISGANTLTGTLDRLSIITSIGAFDAGTINIMYE